MQTIFIHGFSGGGGKPLTPLAEELGLDMTTVELPDMPGFRLSDGELDPQLLTDPVAYSQLVEAKIKSLIRGKKIRLVAYSHGAIPAFLIASRNESLVSQLIVIGPAASVRRGVSVLPYLTSALVRLLGVDRMILLMQSQMMVDTITRYGRKPYWTPEMYATRLQTRRDESKQYNRNMFYLMKQLISFQSVCDDVRLTRVPLTILHITDDEVVGVDSIRWFESHARHVETISSIGGHAIVTVTPDKTAELLKPVLEKR